MAGPTTIQATTTILKGWMAHGASSLWRIVCLLVIAGASKEVFEESIVVNHPDYHPDKVLTVTTILIEPYAMLRQHNSSSPIHVNQLYEGYIVDLMDKIAEVVGFKYRLVPVYDGTFGYIKPDGSWDGMIGELTRKEADIAAGPMYITERRQQTVDFTHPFMIVQASMLMRKSALGGPMGIQSPIDLVNHPSLEFGTLNRGIIRKALRTTNTTLYRHLYERMQASKVFAFTRTNEEGIERVRRENYVYILPDKIAEYVVRKEPCDLSSVGNFLIEEKFGLAVPKHSTLLPYLNRAIDLLSRQGQLQRLQHKWWYHNAECPTATSSKIFSPNKIVARSSSLNNSGQTRQTMNWLLLGFSSVLGMYCMEGWGKNVAL